MLSYFAKSAALSAAGRRGGHTVPSQRRRTFATQAEARPKKIVIVGGVAGGATAAARARRLSEDSEITIVERGPDVSFANCGMPYYIGGEIKDRSKLAVQTPQSLHEILNVNVRTHTEAIAIDRQKKVVKVIDRTSGNEELLSYDKLILAPGAAPMRPPIPGLDAVAAHVFSLRSLQDMDRIFARVGTNPKPRHAFVVGAGYIGLEMVEALVHKGIKVTLVEALPQLLPHLDPEMAIPLLDDIKSHGVQVMLKSSVSGLRQSSNATLGAVEVETTLDGKKTWQTADFVILAAGVKPESKLAEAAGLDVTSMNPSGTSKAIKVNRNMQTSDPDIYAVGDAVKTQDAINDAVTTWTPLAGPANRQARLVADHIFLQGDKNLGPESYRGSLGTAIVRVFDTVAGATGWNEKTCKARGVTDYETATVVGQNHASYYPNSTSLTVKVIWSKADGRLLGAQVAGVDGVDKRLDVLATAIAAKMKVDDLAHLELTYAPPFGNARDVLNTIGFLAQNMRRGLVQPVADLPISEDPNNHPLILDVRAEAISQLHPIKNAVNIPLQQIRSRLEEIRGLVGESNREIVTVCNVGKTSYFAARILAQSGFKVYSVLGGSTLLNAKQKVISAPSEPVAKIIEQIPQPAAPAAAAESVAKAAAAGGFNDAPLELDACGLACPGPIMAIKKMLPQLRAGQELTVKASDPGFANDFPAFVRMHKDIEFIEVQKSKGILTGRLRKLSSSDATADAAVTQAQDRKNISIVVFSSEMDKVLAALVMANGVVATGGEATLFFTFWGLSALRRPETKSLKNIVFDEDSRKSFMDHALAAMLPKGLNDLSLSHINLAGVGAKLMKQTMHQKNLPELESLVKSAVESGKVRFVACTMSMEALGIKPHDLIDNVEYGGVADFLSTARQSGVTLFI